MAKLTLKEREELAATRLLRVLGTHTVATARTLEQKISDGGPYNQRIDPHVLTSVRNSLMKEGALVRTKHGNTPWYSVAGSDLATVAERLQDQLPTYVAMNAGNMSTRVGQALEISVYRGLVAMDAEFCGRFRDLDQHDDSTPYSKEEPPQHIGSRALDGNQNLDFLIRTTNAGWVGVECKNVREWLYPDREEVLETLRKCLGLDCVPVLIARRIPYVSYRLLTRCGVILHQTYNQLLPQSESELAQRAKDKRILGYHDIKLGNEPDDRLMRFLETNLPNIAPGMHERFNEYQDLLFNWSHGAMSYEEFAARVRRREEGLNEDYEPEF